MTDNPYVGIQHTVFGQGWKRGRADILKTLKERIEAIDHPCHDVCFGNLHADCQCAAWIRQESLSALEEA